MKDITISPFTFEDLDAIVSLHVVAFESTKYHQTIFGGCKIEDVKDHSKRAFAFSLNDTSGQRIGLKATNSDDKIVGYALMEERGEGGVEIFEQAPLEGMNSDWATRFHTQEVPVVEHHLKLQVIAVNPAYQRNGVGSALLNHCIKYSDSKRYELYISSPCYALSFYLNHSFQTIGLATNDPDSMTHLLVRLPQPLAPYVISLATPSDTFRLVQIVRHSFSPHSLYKTIYGACDTAELDVVCEERFKGVMNNPADIMYKVSRGNFIVGVAHWELPIYPNSVPANPPPQLHATGTNFDDAIPWFTLVAIHDSEIKGAHYTLITIATEPSFQKKGAAKKLIEWAFEKADKEEVNVCLDSTIEGRPVYDRLGFVQSDVPIVLGAGLSKVTPMIRSPNSLLLPSLIPTSISHTATQLERVESEFVQRQSIVC